MNWQGAHSQILSKAVGRPRAAGLLVWLGGLENTHSVHSGYNGKASQTVKGWEGRAI